MPFFFDDDDDTQVIQKPTLLQSCDVCGLSKGCRTPRMEASGPLKPQMFILGEGPGKEEDKAGEPFTGKHGEYLREVLCRLKIHPEYCRMSNAINCWKDGKATPQEIGYCQERLDADLAESTPNVVLALGQSALRALGYTEQISLMRGRAISDPRGFYIVVAEHPSDLRGHRFPDLENLFVQDVQIAAMLQDYRPVTYSDWDDCNYYLTNPDDIHSAIDEIGKAPHFIFDYETVNLRPFHEDSDILTVSLSTTGECAFGFALSDRYWTHNPQAGKDIKSHFVRMLQHSPAIKVAHNMQFEQEWTEIHLGGIIGGTVDCTMQMAHLLDERVGGASLDFLSMINLGKKKVKGLDVKNLASYPVDKIIYYGNRDARLEARLYPVLKTPLEQIPELWGAYQKLVRPAINSTVRAQSIGALVDVERLQDLDSDIGGKLKEQEKIITELPEIQEFMGGSATVIKMTDDAVRDYLFKHRGYQSIKNTAGGKTGKKKEAVDQEVLEHFANQGDKFCIEYKSLKKLQKIKSTYIDGLWPLIYPDGKFHTNYALHITRTGRLSSADPNMQNFPTRETKEVRKIVIAPDGYILVSYDFKQMEAIILAIISHDRNFADAVMAVGGYDIHYEKAKALYGIERADDMRSAVKNTFVFPSFYGAGAKSIAEATGLSVEFIKYQQEQLWEQFPNIRRYQYTAKDFYLRNLYVETLTGRRRHAPLSHNEVINTPVQGTASDLTLHAMNRLTEMGKLIPLMIHDDLTFLIRISDFWQEHEEIMDVITNPQYGWLDIPLQLDCKIGKNWGEMKKLDSPEAELLLAV